MNNDGTGLKGLGYCIAEKAPHVPTVAFGGFGLGSRSQKPPGGRPEGLRRKLGFSSLLGLGFV